MLESRIIADKIKELLKTRKISVSKMLIDCGMNKNALYTMQSEGYLPRLEAVAQIADYLNCSVDYLLGRTDNPRELTENQQELLSLFNQIEDERNQIKALGQIELIIKEFVNEQ